MSDLVFDNKVVIVTGAGNGLGRSHAMLFAKHGARVVVNDLGGSLHGEGNSTSAADTVVEEIKAAGGEAVANYDSVDDGDKIVKTALDAYGQIDVVVNNAGIIRDSSFGKMQHEDWDMVYRVHLRGAFAVTHAAWPYMREQEYGRVIFTASPAGIYGNFGQANYGTCKLGCYGLCRTLSVEGASKNIHVNTISPVAKSRMTEHILPPEIIDRLSPEHVSPLVVYLGHESCKETGGLFEVGAGWYAKLRWQRTQGISLSKDEPVSADDIAAAWDKITDFNDAVYPNRLEESINAVISTIN